jgi:hypothetical protein
MTGIFEAGCLLMDVGDRICGRSSRIATTIARFPQLAAYGLIRRLICLPGAMPRIINLIERSPAPVVTAIHHHIRVCFE